LSVVALLVAGVMIKSGPGKRMDYMPDIYKKGPCLSGPVPWAAMRGRLRLEVYPPGRSPGLLEIRKGARVL
jgi:hypothetical protein